jgi:putative salt-induced outer membrane protein YdiY
MKRQYETLILICCMLLLPNALFARKATDVIVMKNGDRITGEIKTLGAGALTVRVEYIDGAISLDWARVAYLESNYLFVIKTQDGSSYEGKLLTPQRSADQPMQLKITKYTGETVEVERSQIVVLNQTSDQFHERFNGSVGLGIMYSKGNQATQYSLNSDVEYLRQRWAASANLNSTLSSNSGATVSTRNQWGVSSYHYLPWQNYFYEGLGNFLQSSVQGITLQTTLGGGIGHFFKNTNNTTIAILGGVGWQGTDYTPSADVKGTQSLATGLFAGQVELFKFKKSNFDALVTIFPNFSDPGRVRLNLDASYFLKIFQNLSLNVSFYGNWDNQPPSGLPGSDYGTSSGLRWTFGAK